ncbi:MAG TPA: VCBS repeat-containing protein, partial [Flavobacteriales bacterium]|nr:VCBS repeat-containing protein [Flavobacteriales bacterium]
MSSIDRLALLLCALPFTIASEAQFAPALTVHPSGADLSLHATDVDHDGDLDLVGLFAGQHFKWFENTDGQGSFAASQPVVDLFEDCGSFDIADLDMDGLPDLVLLEDLDNEIWLVRNQGDGNFAAPQLLGIVDGDGGAIRIAELTGDGTMDIVVNVAYVDGGGIAWFAGNGTGFEPLASAPMQIAGAASAYLSIA